VVERDVVDFLLASTHYRRRDVLFVDDLRVIDPE
jgi:hypothetical protein